MRRGFSQPGLLRVYTTNAVRVAGGVLQIVLDREPDQPDRHERKSEFFQHRRAGHLERVAESLHRPECTGAEGRRGVDLSHSRPAATNSVVGVSTDTGAVTMPVAWLYQLQDGTLGPASSGTAANPIVARIAFWADDDTCKININTAGCGIALEYAATSTRPMTWPGARTQPVPPGNIRRISGPSRDDFAGARGFRQRMRIRRRQLLALTPLYAWGGSHFGAVTTTNGETVPAKHGPALRLAR